MFVLEALGSAILVVALTWLAALAPMLIDDRRWGWATASLSAALSLFLGAWIPSLWPILQLFLFISLMLLAFWYGISGFLFGLSHKQGIALLCGGVMHGVACIYLGHRLKPIASIVNWIVAYRRIILAMIAIIAAAFILVFLLRRIRKVAIAVHRSVINRLIQFYIRHSFAKIDNLVQRQRLKRLIRMLRLTEDAHIERRVRKELIGLGSETVLLSLIAALEEEQGRGRIIKILGELRNNTAISPLQNVLTNDRENVMEALDSIAQIGGDDAMDVLQTFLQHPEDRQSEEHAIWLLAKNSHPRALDTVISHFEKHPICVADSLAERKDPRVTPAMVELLNEHKEPRVRRYIATILGKRGDNMANPGLIKRLKTKEWDGYVTPGSIVRDNDDNEYPAILMYSNENMELRCEAARALGELGGANAQAALSEIELDLNDSKEVREAARAALKRIEAKNMRRKMATGRHLPP